MSLQGAGVQEKSEQNTLHPPLLASLTADTTSSVSLKEELVEVISTFFFQALGFRFFANTSFKMRERRRLWNNITAEILTKQHPVSGDHWFKPKMCYFAVNCTSYYYPTYCFLLQIMPYIHACSMGRAFIYKYSQADIWHVAIHQKGPQQFYFYFLNFGATSLLAFFRLYVTGKGLRWEGSHTEKELACNAEEWKHC